MVYLTFQIFGALLWLIAVYGFLKVSRLNRVFGIDLAFVILVSGLIGGRLFHVLYETPEAYLQEPLKIFYLWQGGFVFYGGFILSALASIFYCYYKKQDFFEWADFFAPLLAAGYIYGRIGCFLAGCCYGQSCDLPWAIEDRHPTQLYAVVTEFILLLILLSEKKQMRPQGVLFSTWVLGHAIGRLFMEPYRDDFRGQTIFGLSVSQVLSIGLLAIGGFLITWRLQLNKRP